jgi:hypothetical protein
MDWIMMALEEISKRSTNWPNSLTSGGSFVFFRRRICFEAITIYCFFNYLSPICLCTTLLCERPGER